LPAQRAAAPCDQGIKTSPKCQRESTAESGSRSAAQAARADRSAGGASRTRVNATKLPDAVEAFDVDGTLIAHGSDQGLLSRALQRGVSKLRLDTV